MKNNYVVGAYNTGGHWVTMIICMQFKDVRYLDSAKNILRESSRTSELLWIGHYLVGCVHKNSIS
jgi:Ulp1 family protease